MSDLDNILRIRRSSTAAHTPDPGDLLVAELAVNLEDGRLYTKDNSSAILDLTGMRSLSDDTSPVLGGHLDADGHDILEVSNLHMTRSLTLEAEHPDDGIFITHAPTVLGWYRAISIDVESNTTVGPRGISSDVRSTFHNAPIGYGVYSSGFGRRMHAIHGEAHYEGGAPVDLVGVYGSAESPDGGDAWAGYFADGNVFVENNLDMGGNLTVLGSSHSLARLDIQNAGGNSVVLENDGDDIRLRAGRHITFDSGGSNERMRIASDGTVEIYDDLQVSGNIEAGGTAPSSPGTSAAAINIPALGTAGDMRNYIVLQGVYANDATNEDGGAFIKFRTSTAANYGPEIGGVRRSGGAGDFIIRTGGVNPSDRLIVRDNGVTDVLGGLNASGSLDLNGWSLTAAGIMSPPNWGLIEHMVVQKMQSDTTPLFSDWKNELVYWEYRGFDINVESSSGVSVSGVFRINRPDLGSNNPLSIDHDAGGWASVEFDGPGFDSWSSGGGRFPYIQMRTASQLNRISNIKIEVATGAGPYFEVWNESNIENLNGMWIGDPKSWTEWGGSTPSRIKYTFTFSTNSTNTRFVTIGFAHGNTPIGYEVLPFVGGNNIFHRENTFNADTVIRTEEGSFGFGSDGISDFGHTDANFRNIGNRSTWYADSNRISDGWGFRTHNDGGDFDWALTLDHDGSGRFYGDLDVDGELVVQGTTYLTGPNTWVFGNLGIDLSLDVTGNIAVDGDLTVEGDVNVLFGDIDLSNDLSVDGDVDIGGNLAMSGLLDISSNVQSPSFELSKGTGGSGRTRGAVIDVSSFSAQGVEGLDVVVSESSSSTAGWAVRGASTGLNTRGVFGEADTGIFGGVGVGVYGRAIGSTGTHWAGYFAEGNVRIENDLQLDGTLTYAVAASPVAVNNDLGSAHTFDFATSQHHRGILTDDTTLTVANLAEGCAGVIVLYHDTTQRVITWVGIDGWPGGVVPDPPGSGEMLVVALFHDGASVLATGTIYDEP